MDHSEERVSVTSQGVGRLGTASATLQMQPSLPQDFALSQAFVFLKFLKSVQCNFIKDYKRQFSQLNMFLSCFLFPVSQALKFPFLCTVYFILYLFLLPLYYGDA